VIAFDRVARRYGANLALAPLSVAIAAGDRILLAGPNGAGKSTVLRVVVGLAAPTSGAILSGGAPLVRDAAWRSRLGYADHRGFLYDDLTGAENLAFAAALGGASADVERALAQVGLAGRGGQRVIGYSRGMRQRLALARALVGDPTLLVLDEPTVGLDERGLALLASALEAWGSDPARTLLVAAHDVEAFAGLVGRLWVLHKGRLVSDQDVRGVDGPAMRARVRAALSAAEGELA